MYSCLLETVSGAIRLIHTTFIRQPLYSLYFNGPESLGFWGGAAPEDICFSLTATPSSFWQTNPIQCTNLCEQKFGAFSTFINFALYAVTLFRLANGIMFHVCFTRPVLSELKRLQGRVTHPVYNHVD